MSTTVARIRSATTESKLPTNPMPIPTHYPPPTSSSSSSHTQSPAPPQPRPRMPRANSHLRRTGPGALVIPVPPTLANSPHLQSPNSIFRRAHVGPRASPGAEEERWLRDTVPIGVGVDATGKGVGGVTNKGEERTERGVGGGGRYEEGRTRASSVSSIVLGRHALSVPHSAASARSPPPPTPVMPPRSSTYTYPQAQRDRG